MDFERALGDPGATDPRVQTARELSLLAASLPAVDPAVLERARLAAEAPTATSPSLGKRALVAAVVIAMAVGVVGNAARTARPGDALWDIRRVGQVVRYQLTFSPGGKASLLLSQAEGALQAAQELVARGAAERAAEALAIAKARIASARAVGSSPAVPAEERARVTQRADELEMDHDAAHDPDDPGRIVGPDDDRDEDTDEGRTGPGGPEGEDPEGAKADRNGEGDGGRDREPDRDSESDADDQPEDSGSHSSDSDPSSQGGTRKSARSEDRETARSEERASDRSKAKDKDRVNPNKDGDESKPGEDSNKDGSGDDD